MPGAVVPIFRRSVVAAAAEDGALTADALEKLINDVESAKVVRRDGPSYALDLETLAKVAPAHISLVTASVQRANTDILAATPAAQAASAVDVAKKIDDIGKVLSKGPDVVEHMKKLIGGTKAEAHWWGLSMVLTHDASVALASVTTADLATFLPLLGVAIPAATAVVAIVLAVGAALSAWVKGADAGKGVKIKLYMWVVPWVAGV